MDTSISANIGRILAGMVLLFVTYILGAYLGGNLFADSVHVNKMEILSSKVGSSIGILVISLLIRLYVLRSLRLALTCLVLTETVVMFIVLFFTGLTLFSLADARFIVGWVYELTWNVVVAFLIGLVIGQLWDYRRSNGIAH